MSELLHIPAARRPSLEAFAGYLRPGLRVALSTHVNADGDGCGSEVALARLLAQRGLTAQIVNPTPWPSIFRFLLGEDVRDLSARGADALRDVDLLIVLDINDVSRLGQLADAVRSLQVPRLVIDHHVLPAEPAGVVCVADTQACATGELVFDLALLLQQPLTAAIAEPLYVALLTDTGGFRFSNTSPRCHAIAAALLASGVNPETMYRRVYASVPPGRVHLLREALSTFGHDPERGLAWMSLPAGALERHGVAGEDLDGLVEHARSVVGTRLALFFRDLGYGKVKVSFRSTGDVDANAFARRFGGGGHVRAAGALIAGDLEDVRDRVIDEARTLLASPAAAPDR